MTDSFHDSFSGEGSAKMIRACRLTSDDHLMPRGLFVLYACKSINIMLMDVYSVVQIPFVMRCDTTGSKQS